MQRKDKISSNGPPSLLTPAQQAEAERNRILSTLEASGGKRTSPSPNAARASRAPWIWAFSGVLVAAVAGGAGLWYGQQREPSVPLIVAAAAPENATQTDVTGTSTVAPAADEPATAIIEEDHQARSAPLPDAQPSLSEMLAAEPSAPPAAGATGDVLSQALEAPSGAALAAAAAAPVAAKAAANNTERAGAPAKPKPPVKRVAAAKPAPKPAAKSAPKAAPAPAADGDVMLLSALIAHAQASEPAVQSRTRASLEQELAYCKKQPKAELAACRKRACDGRATAAACKVKR